MGSKHLFEAKRYLKFLESLGCNPNQFTWVLRSLDKSSIDLPKLAESLDLTWRPSQIKIIRPKSATWAEQYSQWVGIMPIDGSGDSLAIVMTKTLFWAKLSLP
jgi:hypothetical protein